MKTANSRKIVLVGCGFVGMSFAYTLLSEPGIDELVLIDVNNDKAQGEAMDLSHGLPYARSKMVIKAGNYEECKDAAIVVITAGAAQKPGQSRLELTAINTRIMKDICQKIKASGFDGIIIVASNPVDLMTYVAQKATGLNESQVIGSGTLLDTARLRYLLSNYFGVNATNIHAYIMGEHGDSSFVPWIHAYIGCKSLLEVLDEEGKSLEDLLGIYEGVRIAAYEIIEKKKATYYGIGLALNRLVHAVLSNENAIMTVSCAQHGEYGKEGLYIGTPAIVNREGVRKVVKLGLNDVDQNKFDTSCENLLKIIKETIDPILSE